MKLKCIVVDDESLARKLLEENISQLPFLHLVASCKNPFEAMEILQKEAIDLMFLDIQMPGMLGTKFLETLPTKPLVIFVTAYSNFAVESYELNVVDYIVKPVSMERFTKAAMKALQEKEKLDAIYNITHTKDVTKSDISDFFFVNADYSLVKIVYSDITHVEAMKDYVKIFLTNVAKPIISKMTLKSIEERLHQPSFVRVHKSYIVNLPKIESIRSQTITIGDHTIPISEGYTESVMKMINDLK